MQMLRMVMVKKWRTLRRRMELTVAHCNITLKMQILRMVIMKKERMLSRRIELTVANCHSLP
jgi:hypothetical protein